MFVKIFKAKATFSGVKYNTRKVDGNKGELMKVANFGPLMAFSYLKPQDYINYLTALAALNKDVKLPQFHAVISAKGTAYDKTTLTTVAEKWLLEMGYGVQPYLIVFHRDTDNNHVHMVSSRVDKQGQKVNSAYEWIRAQRAMDRVLGYETAMKYSFSTKAQFYMILENGGFPGIGPKQEMLQKKINSYVFNKSRAAEIHELFSRHKGRPDLFDFLKANYEIELQLHSAEGKKPYGYSVIDHQEKIVFKGSEIMPLKELVFSQQENVVNERVIQIRSIAIADDVDDQQIHGMRRRRQKRARTNTR